MAGGTNLPDLTPSQIKYHLRAHWIIKNGIYYVRDAIFAEDYLQGRKIAFSLSTLRNAAINLIRRACFRYIPDARHILSATPERDLMWLFAKAHSSEDR